VNVYKIALVLQGKDIRVSVDCWCNH
jgi:hypothetical protein